MLRATSVPLVHNIPSDLLELFGVSDPPETENAAPSAKGNGVKSVYEASNFNADNISDADQRQKLFDLRQGLIANGYRPVPCRGKVPALSKWQESRATKSDLQTWPNDATNTGIVLGIDLVAIDIDVLDRAISGELIELALNLGNKLPLVRAGKKPKTLLLYRTDTPIRKHSTPEYTDAKGQRHKVEILGQGQQFIAYGIHPDTGKPYQWLPETASPVDVPLSDLPLIDLGKLEKFLIDAAAVLDQTGWQTKAALPASEPSTVDNDDDLFDCIEPDWTRIKAALKAIPHEARDEYTLWLKIGMALHAEARGSEEGRALWDRWSRKGTKYDQRVIARKWASFAGKADGVTIGSLYALAKAYEPKVGDDLFTFVTPGDCANTAMTPYIIKHIIGQGDVMTLVGQPGSGKSLLAPRLGYAVAQGRDVFGHRVKQGKVLYLAAEDLNGMKQRVHALQNEHGAADDFLLMDASPSLLDKDERAKLKRTVEHVRPALIVIDTISAAWAGMDENTSEAMGGIYQFAKELGSFGAGVILVCHPTKAGDPRPRGHGCLYGNVDTNMFIERNGLMVSVGFTKNRRGSTEQKFNFAVNVCELGSDEDGDPITTAICQEIVGDGLSPELSAPEQAVFDAMGALLTIESALDDDENPHLNEKSIERLALLDRARSDKRLSKSELPNSQNQAFKRALDGLRDKGVVTVVTHDVTGREAVKLNINNGVMT